MNAGFFRNGLAAILLLSTLVNPARTTLAQPIEPPVVTIVATDHHAAEAEQEGGVFTVSRSGATTASLLVFYQLSGTARNGADYQELPRTVTIPIGAASADITVKPVNDSLAEGTETVVATLVPSPTLSPIEPYRVGFPSSDVILLADNDSPEPPPPTCAPIPEGIVSWWRAESNALDAIDGNAGTVVGGVTFAGGKVGQALSFDGTGEVRIEDNANLNVQNFTLEAWVNPSVLDGEMEVILYKEADEATPEHPDPRQYALAIKGPVNFSGQGTIPLGNLAFAILGISGLPTNEFFGWVDGGGAIPLNQWTHVALTFDGATATTFINGALARRITGLSGEVNRTTGTLKIGSRSASVLGILPQERFNGQIDEASLYHRALPAEEILRLYLAAGAGKCQPGPLVVRIVQPADGSVFRAPAIIRLVASPDYFGDVKKVEFFAGARNLGAGTFVGLRDGKDPVWVKGPVWVFEWREVTPGEYSVTAVATDVFGRTVTSEPVHITVKPAEVEPIVLIPKGSAWKYLDDGSDQGAAWRESGFNDAEWKSGPAQLGFGDGDEATVLRAGNEERRFVSYYFRRAFEVADLEGISGLTLRLLRDDGAVVYLNGHEALRSNMPDGAITFNTLAVETVGPETENLFHSASLDSTLLVSGRNVLAVEVHQVSPVSSDVGFDAELVAGAARAIPVVNIKATDAEAAEISPLVDIPPNPAVFKVTRIGETNKALKVYYRLTGTARNGVDYQERPAVVTIPEGAESAEIVVQPIDDLLVEGTESVVAALIPLFLVDPPAGSDPYVVGPNDRAEAHILDNDPPPPNALPSVRIMRPESGSTFDAPATVDIVVEVRDPDGWVGRVEFLANERKIGEQSIVFIREPDPGQRQEFSFEWKEVPPGEYTLVARATDNRAGKAVSDPVRVRVGAIAPATPVVTIFARDGYAREGTNSLGEVNTATFVVVRTGETNLDLTIFYSLQGSAENGVDYETLPNSVTIPAGRHAARIVLKPIADEQEELIETVVVALEPDPSLGPIARYTIGRPSKAAAIIVDPDQPRPPSLRTSDGLFHLCLPGENGFGFRLETSTDLVTWAPVETNVVSEGAIHYVEPDAFEHGCRFYRVLPEPVVELAD